MTRRLADIRLSGPSLAVLAAVSVAAAALIIAGGSRQTPAQLAALAALREHTVALAAPPAQSPVPTIHGSAGGGSESAVVSAAPPAPVTGPATVGTSPPSSASASSGPAAAGGGGGASSQNTGASKSSSPQVHKPTVSHVFEIALSTTSYAAAFGPESAAPYLRSLEARGTLLSGFESFGASELADNLALVSGQGPNPDTAAGCATYAEFRHGVNAGANGLVPGSGCVYPETALTIGDQVSASGHVWKAYIADMGKQTCAHPNSNAAADAPLPGTDPGYDPTHNPFIYFHSLLDLGDCASDDGDLGALSSDLAHESKTATYSFIAPGACEDATATATPNAGGPTAPPASTTPSTSTTTTTESNVPVATGTASTTTASSSTTPPATTTPTTTSPATTTPTTTTPTTTSPTAPSTTVACPPAGPVGIGAEDAFLRLWVPRILAAAAYKARGVLIIAFAAAGDQHGKLVRTGALVLSPHGRKRKTIATAFGPYSLLRSEEDALGYGPLAHASSAPSFASAFSQAHRR